MFTGIVEQLGTIKLIDGNRFTISHSYLDFFEVGESIALNGMCATILTSNMETLEVEIIAESRKLTTFGSSKVGDLVNLERAAKLGQRNSGHNVTGHIDELGTVKTLEPQDDYWLLRVSISAANRKLLVHKGSVALNGISLTVSGVSDLPENEAWLEVSIISHTWEVTNLKDLAVGDLLNVEFDVLGKYALNLN